MKAVTFALLPRRTGCNLGLITDNLGPGLLIVWCEEPMLEGMIVRRGDGSLMDEMFDSIARVTDGPSRQNRGRPDGFGYLGSCR